MNRFQFKSCITDSPTVTRCVIIFAELEALDIFGLSSKRHIGKERELLLLHPFLIRVSIATLSFIANELA